MVAHELGWSTRARERRVPTVGRRGRPAHVARLTPQPTPTPPEGRNPARTYGRLTVRVSFEKRFTEITTWVERHPIAVDASIAIALALIDLVLGFTTDVRPHVNGTPDELDLVSATSVSCLTFRRQAPWSVFLLLTVNSTVITYAHGLHVGATTALVISLYTVAVRAKSPWACMVAALPPAALVVVMLFAERTGGDEFWPEALASVVPMSIATVALGRTVRRSRHQATRLAEALDRLSDLQRRLADEAVSRERLRIARELHDVIAGSLGVINTRSGVARLMCPKSDRHAKEALHVIETVSRNAVDEMRHLLGALRTGGPAATSRQPGLDDLPDLVTGARRSGLPVRLHETGERRPVAEAVGLAAYRIAQEALTNVFKHAGTVPTTVSLQHDTYGLHITIHNAVGEATTPHRSCGYGLAGMRERVMALGGSFHAEHTLDEGFVVHASLPANSRE
ncbi:sensor histidine kinase [Saccharothrix obliqua]|uniref:sensor histidine kinase n=1 Tax=Saccharothrix obliqua TaxID=2861747 RepID=UPI001C5F90F5|nr:histidine kinase [Saccharothrix obliqua]MBW4718127.1 hypothetical protein [Saccharothrix obliqua]